MRRTERQNLEPYNRSRGAWTLGRLAFLTLILAGCGSESSPVSLTAQVAPVPVSPQLDYDPAAAAGARRAQVTEVVDGDTIEIRIGARTERVRLIGVDAPETKHPTEPVGCYGPEASSRLHELLAEGTDVGVLRDREPRDRFGRLLGYVYRLSDGLFINRSLVVSGHADVLDIAPNSTFATSLRSASHRAKATQVGLWGTCVD